MLAPQVAQERMKAWRVKGTLPASEGTRRKTRFEDALKRLPPKVATAGFAVHGLGSDGTRCSRMTRPIMARLLDELTVEERHQVWSIYFPLMADEIEAAWRFQMTAPYHVGWQHHGFRAPHHPSITRHARGNWIAGFANLSELYDETILDPEFLAAWAPYFQEVGYDFDERVGTFLASVLSSGGPKADAVFEVLAQSIKNEHEIGSMGQHVVRGLLSSTREEAWELIEKTLLAAQRQEGLRQAILEAASLAHSMAFRRLLRLVRDHDLARFSAVTKAVNDWFGLAWDSISVKVVHEVIETTLTMLEDEAARKAALNGNDPQAAYHALWAVAVEDAVSSIEDAAKLMRHRSTEIRYVAVLHLAHLNLIDANAVRFQASDDPDLQVAYTSIVSADRFHGVGTDDDEKAIPAELFERIERLHQRMPDKETKLKPLVWPWTETPISKEFTASQMLGAVGSRSPICLVPYVSDFGTWQRQEVVQLFAKQKEWDEPTRAVILKLAGDNSADVRSAAFAALKKITLTDAETQQTLELLTRKAADLRVGVINLVLKQADAKALDSADFLLNAKDASQRLAGLEVLRQLGDKQRSALECQQRAAAYRGRRPKITKDEERQLVAIEALKVTAKAPSLDDVFGFIDPQQLSPIMTPKDCGVRVITPAAIQCLKELDDLIHEHRAMEITPRFGGDVKLLGTMTGEFPTPVLTKPREGQEQDNPLQGPLTEWLNNRSKKCRDTDGLELVRLSCWMEYAYASRYPNWQEWKKSKPESAAMIDLLDEAEPIPLRYQRLIQRQLDWLHFLAPHPDQNTFLLDVAETLCARVPLVELQALIPSSTSEPLSEDKKKNALTMGIRQWRQIGEWRIWLMRLWSNEKSLNEAELARLWRIDNWVNYPIEGAPRLSPSVTRMISAFVRGLIGLHDFALVAFGRDARHKFLCNATRRNLPSEFNKLLVTRPEVKQLVERACDIIVDIEVTRGAPITEVTKVAIDIESMIGTSKIVRLLRAIGKDGFKEPPDYREESRRQRLPTLTHLVRITHPAPGETPELFTQLISAEVKAKSFPEERLFELAFLAPQWTKCIQHYFQWKGLAEGVYWFLAHQQFMWNSVAQLAAAESAEVSSETTTQATPDSATSAATNQSQSASTSSPTNDADDDPNNEAPLVPPKKLTPWEQLLKERTDLSHEDRIEGAVDVIWFRRVHDELGAERWHKLAVAAKFASNTVQAKKSVLLGDVLLGQADLEALITGIEKKFLKENVRLLGLYPLPTGTKREAELARRFNVLQEYGRYAKKLSGLSKPEAMRAFDIGLKNLASTAGYADALRLDWALGAKEWMDLKQGPVSESKDGVTVTLSLDEQAQAVVVVTRDGKELKAAPAAVKKHAPIAELYDRARSVKKRTSQQRQALEAAMCRGDVFSATELQQLCQHALVAPLLERLVVVGEGVMGYPDKAGKALRNHAGKLEPVKKNESLRIAHPYDLLQSGAWSKWQHDCFTVERVQPFKQVFRELYVLTKAEQQTGDRSLRYAAHQVQPNQALALLGSRGWHTGEGVFKVFHQAGVVAQVEFNHGMFTPLEVEGLTIEAVWFTDRREYNVIKLKDVEPRLFSEVMRDLDLVVSVAHRGGVDPEATASTIEMRSALINETCQLLGLKNVRLKDSHAIIKGKLAEYSIHLGSGVVHRMPGGALCVVPVHAQHRGRLFLPFADADPRTAEVLSKIVLFARDHEIQDPSILDQLRS